MQSAINGTSEGEGIECTSEEVSGAQERVRVRASGAQVNVIAVISTCNGHHKTLATSEIS